MDKDWSDAETSKHLQARVNILTEALRFYANRKHYDLFVRSHTSMGEYETSHILDDCGEIARKALGE